jgi:hypothetical protein
MRGLSANRGQREAGLNFDPERKQPAGSRPAGFSCGPYNFNVYCSDRLGEQAGGHQVALIKCSECGRDISDKAQACPGCGAPLSFTTSKQPPPLPVVVRYERASDTFTGTMALMVKLAMGAIQRCGWKLDSANEAIGLVTFQTRMSFASWSGVSCSLNIEEVSPNKFRVSGTGKQNVRGDQLFALDLFGEAKSKAHKAIEMMKELARSEAARS